LELQALVVSALVDFVDWYDLNWGKLVVIKNCLDNGCSGDTFIGLDGIFLVSLAEVDGV
jgi:hypothetical protein